MRVFPYEDGKTYAESSHDLGWSQKARVVSLLKEYNWDTDNISNENLKKRKKSENVDTVRKLAFFKIETLVNDKDIFNITSDIIPIDVDEFDKIQRERNEALAKDGEAHFDYRDLL